MDFVRCVSLALCISVCGVGSASASGGSTGDGSSQMGPARASSSHGALTSAMAVFPNHAQVPSQQLSANTASTSTTYYGAPYYSPQFFTGYYSSLAAAANAYWVSYQHYWGVYPPNCSFSWAPIDGTTGGTFALMYQRGSNCYGGPEGLLGIAYPYSPAKNAGSGAGCDGGEGSEEASGSRPSSSSSCAAKKGAPMAGDPINASTGSKYLQDDDYSDGNWLTFRRFYNSMASVASTAMGVDWRHSFDRSLQLSNTGSRPGAILPPNAAVMFRPDGKQETFKKANGQRPGGGRVPLHQWHAPARQHRQCATRE